MRQHATEKDLLAGKVGQRFIDELNILSRPWSAERNRSPKHVRYCIFEEAPCLDAPWSDDVIINARAAKRMDVLFYINFNENTLARQDDVAIGLEIKTTRRDLRDDNKMSGYTGYCHYNYLAVYDDLIADAFQKIENLPGWGIMSLSDGRIVRLAQRHDLVRSTLMATVYVLFCQCSHCWPWQDWHIGQSTLFLDQVRGTDGSNVAPVLTLRRLPGMETMRSAVVRFETRKLLEDCEAAGMSDEATLEAFRNFREGYINDGCNYFDDYEDSLMYGPSTMQRQLSA